MEQKLINVALITAALSLGMISAFAADVKADASKPAASQTKPTAIAATAGKGVASVKSKTEVKPKASAKVKLVDINTASSAELKKLPGISDTEAAKIIAGRPYGSKAWLVTNNIIDAAVYEGLKQQVIAKQPGKDAAKNAALYSKKK